MTSLILLLISFIFLIAYVLITTFIYNQDNVDNFSYFNHFPYEIYIKRGYKNALLNILLFLVGLSFATNYILHAIFNFSVMEIFIAFVSVVVAFSFIAIFYLPLSKLKERCLCSILFFVSNIGLNALITINDIRIIKIYENNLGYISLVISLLILIICILFIFNPKLFDFCLEKKDEQTVRPKIFYLAFGEWMLIYIFLFSQIYLYL